MKKILIFIFLMTVLPGVLDGMPSVTLVKMTSSKPIDFGIRNLQTALEQAGFSLNVTGDRAFRGNRTILAGTAEDLKEVRDMSQYIKELSAKPESFVIARPGKNRIAVIGRDDVGTMYGLLDLADQAELSENFSLQSIEEKSKSPYLALRAVNPFLHVQALLDTTSWYFSDDFWEDYLDRLARTRHNLLDIHAAYDLMKTNMPNIFSFFFTDEVFPEIEIPVGREQRPVVLSPRHTQKIFGRFQKIVIMAHARGIRVALMNYNTAVRVKGRELGGEELVGLTRRSVVKLLKGCPNLWMIGFRVGESGQAEDFFQKAYLEPVLATRPEINVYTRTWGAEAAKLREMGRQLKGHLYVEPKYNGEQMGLPYPAMVSPIEGNLPTSYSFEDYTTRPQPFKILWQVRANGTHRVFRWCDPDFVRRTVRSCTLGDAAGYTVEPLTAYYPLYDYLHYKDNPHYGSVRWMTQRNWMWYEVWGRLGYDPDVPDDFFLKEFEKHYGKEAGRNLFRALTQSSRIVPMIFAYHRLGPDHRQMAPGLETGNDRFTFNDKKIYTGSLRDFYMTPTEDREHMYSIADYVDAYLGIRPGTPWQTRNVHAGGDSPDVPQKLYYPSAKFGPGDAADFFFTAARQALHFAKLAEKSRPVKHAEDYDCALDDVRAVAYLGKYYAWKILGTRDLAFFHRTHDYGRLQSADVLIKKAIVAWDSLSAVTAAHYHPFPEWLRMKTNAFSWESEGRSLCRDTVELERNFVEVRKMKPFYGARPSTGWTPVREGIAGKELHIPLFVYSRDARRITLFYKKEGEDGFKSIPFGPSDKHMVAEAVIPASELTEPGVYEYFIQLETYKSNDFPDKKIYPRRWFLNWMKFDETGSRIYFPEEAPQKTCTLYIHPEKNNLRIENLTTEATGINDRTKLLHIRVSVTDPMGIGWVTLHYKGLPSYLPWESKQMVKKGDYYEAEFPAGSEGAVYYIEAGNNAGQAVFYPDFRKERPYLVFPSW